jgi:hypothetical protein
MAGSIPRFHQSMAKVLITQCPAALKWQLENGRVPSRQMEKGTLVDQLVFGGLNAHVIQATLSSGKRKGERATNYQCPAAKDEADEARARGQVPVFEHELEEAKQHAEHIRAALHDFGVDLEQCERQVTHQWVSPEGVLCEGTPDLRDVPKVKVVTFDLKVGYTANPDIWDRKLDTDGCDLQAAAYEEQAQFQYPGLPTEHYIIAAETEAWCPVSIMPVSESYMEIGRKKWARAKRIWLDCWERDEWPGYRPRPLSPPNYVVMREEFAQP